MDIVRWDPFGELDSIHDELNRLFRRSFGAIEPSRRTVANGWMPALDLFETDDKVVARMDLPGIDPKDVEVSVEDASLTVTGSRKFEQETDEEGYHRVERRFGSFTRTIALPASADADRVEATFNRGVLTIEIVPPGSTASLGSSRVARRMEGEKAVMWSTPVDEEGSSGAGRVAHPQRKPRWRVKRPCLPV